MAGRQDVSKAQEDAFSSLSFVRGLARMCDDGWQQGWHERNGGNASYRMRGEEVSEAEGTCALFEQAGAWRPLGVADPSIGGEFFLVTASGSFMRNVREDPARTCGIIEVSAQGDSYRVRGGFAGKARPTSELAGHLLIHGARLRATDGESRVLYHAHPVSVIALSKALPPDAGAFSRVLWRAMTECVMVFPEGVGVVGCMVPGSLELARASAGQMEHASAVVWAHHGLLSSGVTFDDAFGRMHAIVKAAQIHLAARTLCPEGDFPHDVSDDQLRAIARSLGLTLNEALLGENAANEPQGTLAAD